MLVSLLACRFEEILLSVHNYHDSAIDASRIIAWVVNDYGHDDN